jgi:hypothetical protein
MQLKKFKSIRPALALATCSVITGLPQAAHAQQTDDAWDVDSAVLFYSEKDRVSVIEPIAQFRKQLANDRSVMFRVVVDSLTGSTPNGAIPTSSPQTFTAPSGQSGYTTPANQTPLDPTFHDTRYAINAQWETPVGTHMRSVLGASFSTETDYQSFGLSATLSRDFNQRNTTLTLGLSGNADTVSPIGGAPIGLTPMATAITGGEGEGEGGGPGQSKSVGELLLGVTQVISRGTLTQLNYTYGRESGYLTDPYKIVSVVDGTTGELRATNPYLYEKRPDTRTRQALYWKTLHHFSQDVLSATYRYYWDDWGIRSHTFDVKYRVELGGGHYLQPVARYYTQTAADFYRHSLVDGQAVDFVSADYRLGEMTTTTLGLKYGVALSKNGEFGARAELIRQSGNSHPADAIGVQTSQNLFPTVDAYVFQLSYSFRF